MERVIISLFFLIFSGMLFNSVYSQEIGFGNLILPQSISYESCTKVFNTDNVSLLYLTISAINANRFKIEEIQSRSGYVVFSAAGKQFLASVCNVNTNQGMLKITPNDGNYYFQPGILTNIFKYIELNLGKKAEIVNLTQQK